MLPRWPGVRMSHINPSPDKCIACTSCLVACPVARATHKFLGPRTVGPAHERFRMSGLEEDSSLSLCSNCKNCDIACPHGVPVSTFNMLAKAEYRKNHPAGFAEHLLAHGEAMAKKVRFIPAFLKNLGAHNPLAAMGMNMLGISPKAPIPMFAASSFRSQFAALRQKVGTLGQVVFFPGCYMDIYDPKSSIDMVWLLNEAGYEVLLPKSTVCCGLPMVANGFLEDARLHAQKNLQALEPYIKAKIPIVTGCPSCALMFKADIPEFFPDLVNMSGTVQDAQEFILRRVHQGHLAFEHRGEPLRIVYHAPCHLRAQGIGLPGLDLLRSVRRLAVINADSGCCGISGSYGFKKTTYPIGMKVGADLFKMMKNSGAQMGASECGTCRLQMHHGSGLACLHPVSILRQCMQEEEE